MSFNNYSGLENPESISLAIEIERLKAELYNSEQKLAREVAIRGELEWTLAVSKARIDALSKPSESTIDPEEKQFFIDAIDNIIASSYTSEGINQWWNRRRTQLDGLSPISAVEKGMWVKVLKLAVNLFQ